MQQEKLLSKQELKELLRLDTPQSKCIKQKGYKIYPYRTWQNTQVCVYDFGQKIWAENVEAQRYRILLNDYLITIGCQTIAKKEQLNWYTANVYSVKTGDREPNMLNLENCDLQNVIIIENRLIMITHKNVPHFYVVVNSFLAEVSPLEAEQIIKDLFLSAKEKENLCSNYPDIWMEDNGVLLCRKELVGTLYIALTKKNYKVPSVNIDYVHMCKIIKDPAHKNVIRYIAKEAFVIKR